MSPLALLILYLGLGIALGLLRRLQGQGMVQAALCTLAWPLELAAAWLGLLHAALQGPASSDGPARP